MLPGDGAAAQRRVPVTETGAPTGDPVNEPPFLPDSPRVTTLHPTREPEGCHDA
ncbi:hypothetical protein [Paractinoplanes deccanensis]|uniref:hypothetical protein n=1 Tax=Paractinoplanes deccanensis TaxID=113561 RepID=UPI001941E21D|nr:hypothetical protein [Actinoplanes deccanensis]